VRFTVDQLSEALHAPNAPEVVVHEVRLDARCTGWVIAATGTATDAIVQRLNKRATATSYGSP
jgi:hypothetical protein